MEDILISLKTSVFEIFMILILVAVGLYFTNQTPLNDITKAYLEIACTQGGFKSGDIDALKNKLAANGYEKDKITVKIEPAKAININTSTYCSRGEIISIQVVYEKQTLLDQLFKKLGAGGKDTKNNCTRFGMSEKL